MAKIFLLTCSLMISLKIPFYNVSKKIYFTDTSLPFHSIVNMQFTQNILLVSFYEIFKCIAHLLKHTHAINTSETKPFKYVVEELKGFKG